jgi:hypothetical protein
MQYAENIIPVTLELENRLMFYEEVGDADDAFLIKQLKVQ